MSVKVKNFSSNVTSTAQGQLGNFIGKDGKFGLYSQTNFDGDARVLLLGYEKGDSKPSYKFTCSPEISDDLRSQTSEEDFKKVMKSLNDADVQSQIVPMVKMNGTKVFDEDGEPKMTVVYYVGFGDERPDTDYSLVKATESKKAEKEVTKATWKERAV